MIPRALAWLAALPDWLTLPVALFVVVLMLVDRRRTPPRVWWEAQRGKG